MKKRKIVTSFPMFYFLRDEYLSGSLMRKSVEYNLILDIEDGIGGPKPTGYTVFFKLKQMVKAGIDA